MAWFKREKRPIENPTPVEERRVRTEGMWTKCSSCRAIIWKRDLETNWEVCPKCEHHFRLGARRRLELLLDEEPYVEHDADLACSSFRFVRRCCNRPGRGTFRADTGPF